MCNCVYLARLMGGDVGGGYRMGCCKPLWPPAPPLLLSTLSEALFYGTGGAESGSEAEGNLAYLCGILLFSTIWIMIAPILLPSLFLLFTLSRKHRLSSHSLARLPLCFLPFSVRPHPCLSRQLTFLTSALFPLRRSHLPLWVGWFIENAISIHFVPLVILVRIVSYMIGHGAQKLTLNAYWGLRCYTYS